jgi:hypothetical protein
MDMISKTTKKVLVISVISLGVLIIGYFLILWMFVQSINHGEINIEFDRKIALELIDSASCGLERFHSRYGHYPQISGKYFFDSIKTLVAIHEAYVYADSIHSGMAKPINSRFNYLLVDHSYLGAGTRGMIILYQPTSNVSYKLYCVGENGIDENGKGDDIEK